MHERSIFMALTKRQEAFCQHYVFDFNCKYAYDAAIKAGYARKWARSHASRELTKPDIIARIRELNSEKWKPMHMDADELIARISQICRASLGDFHDEGNRIDVSKVMGDNIGVVNEYIVRVDKDGNVERKIKLESKAQAMALLSKIQGLQKDNVDITSGGEPVKSISPHEFVKHQKNEE